MILAPQEICKGRFDLDTITGGKPHLLRRWRFKLSCLRVGRRPLSIQPRETEWDITAEDRMSLRRTLFCVMFAIGAVGLIWARTDAQPVLIKLHLEKPADWSKVASSEVIVYQEFEGFVLAELERTKLAELDKLGLTYHVVDEDPWSEEYFLVSPVEGAVGVDVGLYGKILLQDGEWRLIKAPRQRAFELMENGYRLNSVSHKPKPLKYRPRLKAAGPVSRYSADIDSLIGLVSEDSLSAWVQRLQDFQTRYSYSDSVLKSRDWLYDKFVSFGIGSVWLHPFHWDSDQWNVVAVVPGTASPDRVLVVGGHYDSVVYGGGTDPYVWAPGADDDATGTAATLEMARIIASDPLPVTVVFALFAQEEQGLVGSDYLAGHLYHQNTAVELMINLDMIAYNPNLGSNLRIFANPSAMDFVNLMIGMANTYTYLNPYYAGQSGRSDHYSFYQWGYDAVFAHEAASVNNTYHNNYDVIDSLDFPYFTEVVRMSLATLSYVGGSPSQVGNLRAIDAGDGSTIYLSWSENPPGEEVLYYNVRFGTASGVYDSLRQTSGPADTLRDLLENTTYFITVSAVDVDGLESMLRDEVSVAPRVVPLPPAGLVAQPEGRYKIRISWSSAREADFDYYEIYRSEESGSAYQLLSSAYVETTFVDSALENEVPYYYYTLTTVDTSGNESQM
jgi:hypothetical protein